MAWRGFGFVHHSRTLFCRAVPNPYLTIRNFFIAVRQAEAEAAVASLEAAADTQDQVPGPTETTRRTR
jgi:hypothetical protein